MELSGSKCKVLVQSTALKKERKEKQKKHRKTFKSVHLQLS
jgi:hypothetical protein